MENYWYEALNFDLELSENMEVMWFINGLKRHFKGKIVATSTFINGNTLRIAVKEDGFVVNEYTLSYKFAIKEQNKIKCIYKFIPDLEGYSQYIIATEEIGFLYMKLW